MIGLKQPTPPEKPEDKSTKQTPLNVDRRALAIREINSTL